MSFKKRSIGISSKLKSEEPPIAAAAPKIVLPGVRPSPIDGRPTTSTGNSTLDALLAGHGGLALGCSLLIQESGTTDYAGALLKFYAAEGLLQGHQIHVVGLPEQWGRELPGTVEEKDKTHESSNGREKMKIAWRYESLGAFGSTTSSREAPTFSPQEQSVSNPSQSQSNPFNHTFDLTKRLVHPASSILNFIPVSTAPGNSPFTSVFSRIQSLLTTSPQNTIHRLLIPTLLSPMLYPPHASNPRYILAFLHSLRSLLSMFKLSIIVTLPLSLYPRSTGLTRWMELLSDGVFELAPFPHTSVAIPAPSVSDSTAEEPPQGLLRIHKLPILHELGSGTRGYDDDWTFSLSRRRLNIKPFNLPPLEGDTKAQQETAPTNADTEGKGKGNKPRKDDMEF